MIPEHQADDSQNPTPSLAKGLNFEAKTMKLQEMKTGLLRLIKAKWPGSPDDILHDVVIEVLMAKEFRNLEAFIIRVTENVIAKAYEKRKKRVDFPHSDPETDITECAAHLADSSPSERELQQEREVLSAYAVGALDNILPSNQARVLMGLFIEKKSREELAVELGTSVNNISKLKRRGLEKMRQEVQAYRDNM